MRYFAAHNGLTLLALFLTTAIWGQDNPRVTEIRKEIEAMTSLEPRDAREAVERLRDKLQADTRLSDADRLLLLKGWLSKPGRLSYPWSETVVALLPKSKAFQPRARQTILKAFVREVKARKGEVRDHVIQFRHFFSRIFGKSGALGGPLPIEALAQMGNDKSLDANVRYFMWCQTMELAKYEPLDQAARLRFIQAILLSENWYCGVSRSALQNTLPSKKASQRKARHLILKDLLRHLRWHIPKRHQSLLTELWHPRFMPKTSPPYDLLMSMAAHEKTSPTARRELLAFVAETIEDDRRARSKEHRYKALKTLAHMKLPKRSYIGKTVSRLLEGEPKLSLSELVNLLTIKRQSTTDGQTHVMPIVKAIVRRLRSRPQSLREESQRLLKWAGALPKAQLYLPWDLHRIYSDLKHPGQYIFTFPFMLDNPTYPFQTEHLTKFIKALKEMSETQAEEIPLDFVLDKANEIASKAAQKGPAGKKMARLARALAYQLRQVKIGKVDFPTTIPSHYLLAVHAYDFNLLPNTNYRLRGRIELEFIEEKNQECSTSLPLGESPRLPRNQEALAFTYKMKTINEALKKLNLKKEKDCVPDLGYQVCFSLHKMNDETPIGKQACTALHEIHHGPKGHFDTELGNENQTLGLHLSTARPQSFKGAIRE